MTRYDVIVLGLGGMGSATLYHLSRRGVKVLGLERYDIPNSMGSSHGVTRIIRLAYYEHPSYVPLLVRAYELWHQMEDSCGRRLLITTGSVDAGPKGSDLVEGSRASCRIHNLPYEELDGAQVNQRFPGYGLPADFEAVYQSDGGFLLPEECILAHVTGALESGAEVHGREQVLDWEELSGEVVVRTDRATYRAEKLVVCVGSWTYKLVPQLAGLAVPERQVVAWFQPRHPRQFQPQEFPVFNLLESGGRFYGLPIYGVPGLKVGCYHHLQQTVDPDGMDREPHAEDEELLRGVVQRCFPNADGPTLSLQTCLFTNTPDEHFILDGHPEFERVWVAAGFSGHGFKFSSVVGEIMADLVQQASSRHDLGLFRMGRFQTELHRPSSSES